MKTMTILVAAQQLIGGVGPSRHELAAGAELTPEEAGKLGLDDEAIVALIARGALVETPVRAEGDALATGEAMTAAEMHAALAAAGVDAPADAGVDALFAAALAHGADDDLAKIADRIERAMKAEELRDELTTLGVAFEGDANKATLARQLVLARAGRTPA